MRLTDAEIDAQAARLKALERVAHAADVFMRHITGFRLHIEGGEPVDVFTNTMPEGVMLRDALQMLRKAEESDH